MKLTRFVSALALPLLVAAAPLPDNSVYQVGSHWTNQDNKAVEIGDLRGKVQVMTFVYTYCEHTCPTILAHLKELDSRIPESQRSQVNITLVSLDPERDTPEVLKAYMADKGLDESRWTMLHGDPGDVRELSAMFGVRYRPMGHDDIAHSNMITVLDTGGVIRYQMKGLNEDLDATLEAIAEAVEK